MFLNKPSSSIIISDFYQWALFKIEPLRGCSRCLHFDICLTFVYFC